MTTHQKRSVACLVEGCHRSAKAPGAARGLCRLHYWRLRQTGETGTAELKKQKQPQDPICAAPGCAKPSLALSLCEGHYRRWKRYGIIADRVPRKPRATTVKPKKAPSNFCSCGAAMTPLASKCRSCHHEARRRVKALCSFTDCEMAARSRGMCQKHYTAAFIASGSAIKARARRSQRTKWMADIKIAAGCIDCGYKEHFAALDFDHRDPSTKKFEISRVLSTAAEATILAEVAKCDVRCANCHRIKTYLEAGKTRQAHPET